jgi:hypothetical protein
MRSGSGVRGLKGDEIKMGGYVDALMSQNESKSEGRASIHVKTITIPAARLLTLKAIPLAVLPNAGIGKAYQVHSSFAIYRAGSTPFTLDAGGSFLMLNLVAPNVSEFVVGSGQGFLDQVSDQIIDGAASAVGLPRASVDNQPLTITEQAAVAMTLGNGSLTLVLFYSVIDLTLLE